MASLPTLTPAPQSLQRTSTGQLPALSQKRPAPPLTDVSASKMPKVMSVGSVTSPKQPKMRVRFSCTPCHLRFNEYSEVLKHWEIRHLKVAAIRLCRVDQCQECRSKIAEELPNLPPETFEEVAEGDGSLLPLNATSAASEEDVICLD